jgi:hypothetical protein
MAAESVVLPLVFAYGLSAFKAIAYGVMSVDSRMGYLARTSWSYL